MDMNHSTPSGQESKQHMQPSAMAELMTLIEKDIPDGRQSLRDSFSNLDKVADYCEDNYFRCDNKRAALEETKNYTTQSLASVAYQINTLAYHLLNMLDLQAVQMADMESQINFISQTVAIHKEKVARREIGILTANKVNARQHKILVPAAPEKAVRYVRRPIDYTVLDQVGHGVIVPQQQQQMHRKRSSLTGAGPPGGYPNGGSSGASGHYASGSHLPAPQTKPPTPPSGHRMTGTLSRGSKEYRTPAGVLAAPIAPPQVPSNYAPNYPIATLSRRGSAGAPLASGQYSQSPNLLLQRQGSSGSGQTDSSASLAAAAGQPQVGMVQPLPSALQQDLPPPPPPLPTSAPGDGVSGDHVPHFVEAHHQQQMQQQQQQLNHTHSHAGVGAASPPLPPPPPPPPPGTSDSPDSCTAGSDSWIPRQYLEKVIAIYDYAANRFDELSFQENAVIYVVKKNDDGWYEGVLNGITGLFPGNYVEPCL